MLQSTARLLQVTSGGRRAGGGGPADGGSARMSPVDNLPADDPMWRALWLTFGVVSTTDGCPRL